MSIDKYTDFVERFKAVLKSKGIEPNDTDIRNMLNAIIAKDKVAFRNIVVSFFGDGALTEASVVLFDEYIKGEVK